QRQGLPGSAHSVSTHARGLRPRRVRLRLARTASTVLPSACSERVGTREKRRFRGSILCLRVPLSTLRRRRYRRPRMTRGQCGWLNLHCQGLTPFSTVPACPGACPNAGAQPLPEAGARHERTLEAVSSRPMLGCIGLRLQDTQVFASRGQRLRVNKPWPTDGQPPKMHTEGEPPKQAYEYTRIWGIALETDAVECLVL